VKKGKRRRKRCERHWRALPSAATATQLRRPRKIALAPYKAAGATREEKARLESERQAQRHAVEWKVDLQLDHIARYLQREYDFDGGYSEMRREADRCDRSFGRRDR